MDVPGIEASTIDDLFGEASQLFVGVASGERPHVTPELVAVGDGRLWCLTAAVTRKAAVLATDNRVGFMASTERGHAVGIGRATVVDPASAGSLSDPIEVARAAIGTARFAVRNAAELAGAAVDLLTGKLGRPLPPHRVVVSIEPVALAVLRDNQIDVWGNWATGAVLSHDAQPPISDVDDEAAPPELRELLEDGPSALGWFAIDGHPLVLPATWHRVRSTAVVPAQLFVQCGSAERSPAAVTRDKWTTFGPTGKQGVMLRGAATAVAGTEGVDVVVDVDRVTYWDGIETHTTTTA